MSIRFATILLAAYSVLVMDISAATITVYPTADQSATDLESFEQGTSFDGVFDFLGLANDGSLTMAKSPAIGLEIRTALEFAIPSSLPLDQITQVLFCIETTGRSFGDDLVVTYLNTYLGDGMITLSDFSNKFIPDAAFAVMEAFPQRPRIELDLTLAVRRIDAREIGILMYRETNTGTPTFASSEFGAATFLSNSPQLVISYNPVPEPSPQVTLLGLLCGVRLLKTQTFLYTRRQGPNAP